MKFKSKKNIIIGLIIIAAIILLDQLTKLYIINSIQEGTKNSTEIIKDFLYISHVRNTGAAWSIFEGNKFILLGVSGTAIAAGFVFLFFTEKMSLTIPLAMIIGGGAGNLIDRIFRKSVVDFIDVYIFGYDFPVFNAADSLLVCGTIYLAVFILFIFKEDDWGFRSPFKWKK